MGPSNYGLLDYGYSLIFFFATVSKLGMESVVVAEIVRKPGKAGDYVGTALVMRLAASVCCFLAVWGVIAGLEPDNHLLQVVTMLQATAVVFQGTEVFYFWFQSKLQMKYVTLASIAALTATGIWRICLLVNEASVEWFAFSASVSALVCGICISVFFFRKSGVRLRFHAGDGRYIIGNSYHFLINGLAVALYMQVDKVMLGKMVGETAVGLYGVASTLAMMWECVPQSLIQSASPILIKMYDENKEVFVHRYQMLLMGITVLGGCVGIAFTVFAKWIILFLYGEAYRPAVPALGILIWSTCFAMIGSARSIWIIASGKHKYSKYFTLLGAAVNILLNALLIPVWGFLGAAFTTLVSQMIVALAAPALFKETREFEGIYFGAFTKIPLFWKAMKTKGKSFISG